MLFPYYCEGVLQYALTPNEKFSIKDVLHLKVIRYNCRMFIDRFISFCKHNWPAKLFILSGLLLVFGLLVHPLGDPDVYMHLRDGRYWLETGFHVDKEPFAYTVPGKNFEKAEWIFRIGLYLVHQAGGINLLILVKALLMTLAIFLLGQLIYRRWKHLGIAAALLGLAILAPMTRIFPERPYIFTYLFLPLTLLWLDDYRKTGGNDPRADWRLWKIPALIVLWTNLHPGFMVIFGFLGAQAFDEAMRAWLKRDAAAWHRLKTLLLVCLASVLAGAVNPLGFTTYSFTLDIMQSRDYMTFLTEWMPPHWNSEPIFFLLLILVWATQLINWTKIQWRDVLPLAAFSYMALKSYRNMPLFLIAALPILAGNLAELWNTFKPKQWTLTAEKSRTWFLGGSAFIAFVLLLALSNGYAFRGGEIPRFYPQGALTWLSKNPLQGRLLTHDIWGGYTGWFTHGRTKVFMDGRMPTYGEKIYGDYRKMIWGDPQAWAALLQKYQIEAILVSPKNDIRLYQMLWGSGSWNLVYWDDVSLLYVRRQGPNQPLVNRYAYAAVDPRHIPYFNPSQPNVALLEIQRAQTQTPNSFLPYFFEGDLMLRMGMMAQSRRALVKTLTLAADHPPTLLDLAIIDRKENRLREAEHGFRRVLNMPTDPPVWGMAAYQLSAILEHDSDPVRHHEALTWVEKSLQWMPGWEPALELKQRLQSQK